MNGRFSIGLKKTVGHLILQNKILNLNIKLDCSEDYRNLFKKHVVSVKDIKIKGKKFFEGFGIIDAKEMDKWSDQVKLI